MEEKRHSQLVQAICDPRCGLIFESIVEHGRIQYRVVDERERLLDRTRIAYNIGASIFKCYLNIERDKGIVFNKKYSQCRATVV